MEQINIIPANWNAPKNIIAFSTTRLGGVSKAPYHSLNLGAHCGDRTEHVEINRQRLIDTHRLPAQPAWLQQIHSNIAVKIDEAYQTCQADASYTDLSNTVCAILTADCLPILLSAKDGSQIAAIHAGWRGLANNIIEHTVKKLSIAPEKLLVWLGPAISQTAYRVGNDMREAFITENTAAEAAFIAADANHWYADLSLLARQRLHALHIDAVYGGDFCTYTQDDLFYSYRRDGKNSGRIASLIYRLKN